MLICTKEFVGCFKMNSAGKSSSNEDGFDFFFFNGIHSEKNLANEAKPFQFW